MQCESGITDLKELCNKWSWYVVACLFVIIYHKFTVVVTVLSIQQIMFSFSLLPTHFFKANWQSWNEEKSERKLSGETKHNRKIEALCSLLCERLARTASLFCETLEAQVKLKTESLFLIDVLLPWCTSVSLWQLGVYQSYFVSHLSVFALKNIYKSFHLRISCFQLLW